MTRRCPGHCERQSFFSVFALVLSATPVNVVKVFAGPNRVFHDLFVSSFLFV